MARIPSDLAAIQTRWYRLSDDPSPLGVGDEAWCRNGAPPVDIEETDKEYVVTVDLPAVRKEDLKVQLERSVLTLQGVRRQRKEEKGKKYHRIERQYGLFVRRFMVPSAVDGPAVLAEYTNGVLRVRLPKSAVSRPTTVDVKVA